MDGDSALSRNPRIRVRIDKDAIDDRILGSEAEKQASAKRARNRVERLETRAMLPGVLKPNYSDVEAKKFWPNAIKHIRKKVSSGCCAEQFYFFPFFQFAISR